jgi:transcriptional regulator with XRE-family HTH domain
MAMTIATGIELRLLRTSLSLTVKAVAEAAGVSHQRISAVEMTARPTENAVRLYLTAIANAQR